MIFWRRGRLNDVDKQLQVERRRRTRNGVKLLVFGPKGSGKSTLLKQMRIKYGKDFTEEERKLYGSAVRSNIVDFIRKLLFQSRKLGLLEESSEEPSEVVQEAYKQLACLSDSREERSPTGSSRNDQLFLQHWRSIQLVWKSKSMSKLWSRRERLFLDDDHDFIEDHAEFLEEIERIADPEFRPTNEDILRAYVRKNQVVMERYQIDDLDYEMYDVSGLHQKQWANYLEDADAVIFVAALPDYICRHSRTKLDLEDSIVMFQDICNSMAFAEASIMLFLSQRDVLEKRLASMNRRWGGDSVPLGKGKQRVSKELRGLIKYILGRFFDCLNYRGREDFFAQVTSRSDEFYTQFVHDSTRTMIQTNNIRRSGFLGGDPVKVRREALSSIPDELSCEATSWSVSSLGSEE